MNIPIAHVRQDKEGEWKIHSLDEHLREVGDLAEKMAESFGSGNWAKLAGIWHDLGKYRPAFQKHIHHASGYDLNAHIEQKQTLDHYHSTAGALYAIEKLNHAGRILAYLIAGHHAGLPDWNAAEAGNSALSIRLEEAKKRKHLEEALAESPPAEILNQPPPTTKIIGDKEGLHLWMRMLFSCLVDADFLDTERFMSPEKASSRLVYSSISNLRDKLDAYMANKVINQNLPINKIRKDILQACRDTAESEPGIFSLTVPTGGGKTLSSIAFALEHAAKYNKSRIIVAIPYTSIIEQTANQYREIFGDSLIEHHSNLDPKNETPSSRLACENWDAPIIVTTNVQLLESLFAAKTSRCRKLHNIANSVIIIDEAQLLPPEFLQPTLSVLRLLTMHYGVTLLLSTATQPALNTMVDSFDRVTLQGLDNVKEIIPNVAELYHQLDRVIIEKPIDMNKRTSWEELACELIQYPSVLAIVNTRKDCRILFDLMPKGTIHLSGLMCGQHRSEVIAEIKRKLNNGEPTRVVSTQLVEAGVDIDFPVVYRAITGLDSIAQAAGRCNREGKLLQKGKVVVFIPPKAPPAGQLLAAEQATRSVWHNTTQNPLSHKLFSEYFKHYFHSTPLDKHEILERLTRDAGQVVVQFRSAAEKFKIIDDKATQQILIPYNQEAENALGILRSSGPERYLMRTLQRYTVMVYQNDFQKLKDIGAIEEISLGIWAVCVTNGYDQRYGLLSVDDFYSGAINTFIL